MSANRGLGKLLASQGQLQEAEYRFARIAENVVPNTKRLLDFSRAQRHPARLPDLRLRGLGLLRPARARARALSTDEQPGRRARARDHRRAQAAGRTSASSTRSAPAPSTRRAIDLVLRVYGVDTLLFVGVSTNMCVEGTMRDAADTASAASSSRTPAAPTPRNARGRGDRAAAAVRNRPVNGRGDLEDRGETAGRSRSTVRRSGSTRPGTREEGLDPTTFSFSAGPSSPPRRPGRAT